MALARPDPAALAARVERRADALAGTLVRAWRSELADLASADTARLAISLFTAAIRGGHPAERDRLDLARAAAGNAGEGVPLPTLVAAFGIGARVVLEALREDAGPSEQPAVLDAASRLLIANAQIVADLARAYQNESADEAGAQNAARRGRQRALVRDLIAGISPSQPMLLEEFQLAEGAIVLALTFADEPADDADEVGEVDDVGDADELDATAPRKRETQPPTVQRALDVYFGRAVPMLLEAHSGHVLVPRDLLSAPQGPALDEIAARIAAVRPSAKVAAAAAASPAEIARAARTASEVLRLAGRLGRPAGAYRLADVLLEYHLTRRDESTPLLGELLAPLADRPELLETVRVYLQENYDRRRAARRLSLHPNTVDNRLARTTELTGLDPSTPRGVTLLMTALALRDLG